ncbi:MAG: hypothetical protein Q8M15_02595 [Bacteroidota bacterium]|nr:hypothetical protein [Bacteroidota bacterium]
MTIDKTKLKNAAVRVGILLFWTCMLSGLIFVLGFAGKQEQELSCKKVFVSIKPLELQFFNRQRVLEVIRKGLNSEQKLLGMPLSEINISKLEKSLLKESLIEDAEVYSDLNGVLNIQVDQRKPLLRVVKYDGTQFYIDQHGIKMSLSEHFTARVPIANGNIFERFEKGDSVYSFVGIQLFKIASYVDKDAFLKALIEQIFVRADNEFVIIPKIGNHIIIFGSADNLEKKFRKLLVFYREGLNRTGWKKYSSIDLRFEGQVICKK